MLEYMTIGHQCFYSKRYTCAQAMHGGAANGLKSMTQPHYFSMQQQVEFWFKYLLTTYIGIGLELVKWQRM